MGTLPLIEPTEAERKNGWTAETLTAYVAEARKREGRTIRDSMEGRNRPLPRMQLGRRMRWSRTRRYTGNNCN